MKEIDFKNDITYLKGVGPKFAEKLNNLGIYNINELLEFYPRVYEDRTTLKRINEFIEGEYTLFSAKIDISSIKINRFKRNLNLLKCRAYDGNSSCNITWFNKPYLKNTFKNNLEYIFYGKVVNDKYGMTVENPNMYNKIDLYKVMGIYPIYPLTNGLVQSRMFKIMSNLFEYDFKLEEYLDESILKEYNLCDINYANEKIHFPKSYSEVNIARKRLIFNELFDLMIALKLIKSINKKESKSINYNNLNITKFLEILPFKLTNAQNRTINEIIEDFKSNKVMTRMVQGDVGSGKTIVALLSIYITLINGYQAAMMAPTTILANQHYNEAKEYFDKLGFNIALITSATTKKEKEIIKESLKSGEIKAVIGTHSLIEDDVKFKNLKLVITDEQHRFGVKQRMKISCKGIDVDTLVMTATPIPRTLSLMLYGDLDLSLIDELPPGRQKIDTFVVDKSFEERINNFISKEIDAGRQAYIVCPLVELDEESLMKSVEEVYTEYINSNLSKYNISVVHGKMKTREKDEVMNKFKNGEIDILISTTVIEVGVNVPNATLMVIESSERFGLAALHQLRGRVGRGSNKSYCILKSNVKGQKVMERLKIMEKSNNGFYIAEKDLELRGPGDYFGIRQSGLPEFKLADLLKDVKILNIASIAAQKVLEEDEFLSLNKNLRLKERIKIKFGQQLKHIGL